MKKEGQIRIPSGCAISGIFSKNAKPVNGDKIITSISVMHDRSNGLGGGFAGYGIYPEYKDWYAFHIFYDNDQAKQDCEKFLIRHYEIAFSGEIPTRKTSKITEGPIIWRYFVKPLKTKIMVNNLTEDEYIVRCVMKINTQFKGTYVFSSGKNMGVFKAVGFPEDVGEFYKLEEYNGYCWTAHGRYPTNTPGWWGGAHPFALLDFAIVHNGEISSYDANRRHMEMFGYACTLQTDTEVITYIIDYLIRKQGFTFEELATIVAAPFWSEIDNMPSEQKEKLTYLRNAYASLLITGPFSILVGFDGGMMALNDRLKLRSMVVGSKDDMVYIASEECAIRVIEPNVENVYAPKGGEAVIVTLNKGVK